MALETFSPDFTFPPPGFSLPLASQLLRCCPDIRSFWKNIRDSGKKTMNSFEHSVTCRVLTNYPEIQQSIRIPREKGLLDGSSEIMPRKVSIKLCSTVKCCNSSSRSFDLGCSKCRLWFQINCVDFTE